MKGMIIMNRDDFYALESVDCDGLFDDITEPTDLAEEGIFIETKKGKMKVSENLRLIEEAISNGLTMVEKSIPLMNKYITDIDKPYKADLIPIAKKFQSECVKIDYDRGSDELLKKHSAAYVKLKRNKVFNRADYKSGEITPQMEAFLKKCSKGGEYANRVDKCVDEFEKIKARFNKLYDKIITDEAGALYNVGVREYKFFARELALYNMDMKYMLDVHTAKKKKEK